MFIQEPFLQAAIDESMTMTCMPKARSVKLVIVFINKCAKILFVLDTFKMISTRAVIAVCGPCPEDVVGTLIEVRRDYIGKAKFDSQSLLKVIFINHM